MGWSQEASRCQQLHRMKVFWLGSGQRLSLSMLMLFLLRYVITMSLQALSLDLPGLGREIAGARRGLDLAGHGWLVRAQDFCSLCEARDDHGGQEGGGFAKLAEQVVGGRGSPVMPGHVLILVQQQVGAFVQRRQRARPVQNLQAPRDMLRSMLGRSLHERFIDDLDQLCRVLKMRHPGPYFK